MNDVIYTPFDLSEAVRTGRRRFWKQVLPVTKINYKGQEVDFNPDFHMDLTKSFREQAFDQVPVVFADGDNRHTMDPRQFGGDVLDLQYRGPGKDQGTWALIEADKDAAKAIKKNPRLGVSARIRQMVEKADGRSFPRAIEHICLTMNPRVTGMGPWQAVDLSEEDADIEVVDLTAVNYEEGNEMGKTKQPKSTSTDTIDLSALDDDEFQALLDLTTAEAIERGVEVGGDEDEEEEEVEETPTARKPRRKKSRTKVTIDKESEDDGGDEDEEEDEEEDETDLSDSEKVIRRDEVSQFSQMRIDLANDRWQTQRGQYLDAGVPAFLLDLAEPVLSLPDPLTIDLSDDETLDASDTIRKMLDGVKGVVDLTGEIGHQVDLSDGEDSETDAFLKAWDEQYG